MPDRYYHCSTFAFGFLGARYERIGNKRKIQSPSQRGAREAQAQNGINGGDPSGVRMGSRPSMPDLSLSFPCSALRGDVANRRLLWRSQVGKMGDPAVVSDRAPKQEVRTLWLNGPIQPGLPRTEAEEGKRGRFRYQRSAPFEQALR